jgi:hypothetical protein
MLSENRYFALSHGGNTGSNPVGDAKQSAHFRQLRRLSSRCEQKAQSMSCCLRAAVFVALLLTPPAAFAAEPEPPASAAPPPQTSPAQPVHVEGFRSAQWGMTEPQIKAAIAKDFKVAPDKIRNEDNLAERTHVLTIIVPDLLEGAGSARVSYIFGYATKKLIQVNLLWGSAEDQQIAAEKIVAAADQLRQLLLDSGYEPQTIVTNSRMNDGEMLVFKGEDADKHMTILRLAAAAQPARRGSTEKPTTATALALSYILDAQSPDIYRLKKGQF